MILFLLILATNFIVGNFFDPSKIDYCNKFKCRNGEDTIACPDTRCFKSPERTELLDDLVGFRKTVVDVHNDYRNKIARGDEKDKNKYPSAADMHALTYDLELEHLARCYLLSTFVKGHESCRRPSFCGVHGAGQNLYGSANLRNRSLSRAAHGTYKWYRELTFIPEELRESVIDHYNISKEWGAGHFTQLVWATMFRIGCVQAFFPTNTVSNYKYILACNYAGPDQNCGANIKMRPIYTSGKPCSKCGDVKCNKDLGGKYDALCGEVKPIPTDPPTVLRKKGEKEEKEDKKEKKEKEDKEEKKEKEEKGEKKGKSSKTMSSKLLYIMLTFVVIINFI